MPLEYSIGDFNFIAIDGYWVPPAEVVSLDQRGGVDGTQITAHGKKGRPFPVTTQVDQPNYAVALATIKSYQDLIDADPVALVLAGSSSESVGPGFLVAVLDVEIIRCQILAPGAMGGLNPPSLAWLECRWQLIAIAGTSEE